MYITQKRGPESESAPSEDTVEMTETLCNDVPVSERTSALHLNKKNSVLQEISVNSVSNSSIAPKSVKATDDDLDFLMNFDDDIQETQKGVKKHRRDRSSASRRRTLSPASTKAILQQEIEDTLKSNNDVDVGEDCHAESSTSATTLEQDLQYNDTSQNNHEESLVSKKRSLLLDSSQPSDDVDSSPHKVLIQQAESDDTASSQGLYDQDMKNVVCNIQCDEVVSDPFQSMTRGVDINSNHCDGRKDGMKARENNSSDNEGKMETSSCEPVSQLCSVDDCSLEEVEMKASQRYDIRLQVAKWKYFWEMASADAARSARYVS